VSCDAFKAQEPGFSEEMVMEGNWGVVCVVFGVDDGKPCRILQIYWYGRDVVEEKVVFLQDLRIGCRPNKVSCSAG